LTPVATAYAICEHLPMPHKQAATTGEATVAAALATTMRRYRRGERVVDLSMSGVGIINFMMLVGIGLDPNPYRWLMAVQIGLPCVSFVLTWHFQDRERGSDNRYIAFLFSNLFTPQLALIAFGHISLVSRLSLVVGACVTGLVVSALLTTHALINRRFSATIPIMMAGSLALYCYSALYQLNCVLDRSPAMVYESKILAKGLTYLGPNTLEIRPWIQGGDIATVGVSPKIFHSVLPGDTICIVQRSGALHMPWFTAQTSPWTGGTVDFGPVGGMFRALRRLIGASPKMP
jgi:hypothetical protein